MFGEDVILGKAIDYIAYRVKQGHEEKSAKRELLQNLKFLLDFYTKITSTFYENYGQIDPNNINNEKILETFEVIIDRKLAANIWQYLEFDRIFMLENKTIIDYLIDFEYNRNIIDNDTFAYKHGMTSNLTDRVWNSIPAVEYINIIISASKYIMKLENQVKLINKIIEELK